MFRSCKVRSQFSVILLSFAQPVSRQAQHRIATPPQPRHTTRKGHQESKERNDKRQDVISKIRVASVLQGKPNENAVLLAIVWISVAWRVRVLVASQGNKQLTRHKTAERNCSTPHENLSAEGGFGCRVQASDLDLTRKKQACSVSNHDIVFFSGQAGFARYREDNNNIMQKTAHVSLTRCETPAQDDEHNRWQTRTECTRHAQAPNRI